MEPESELMIEEFHEFSNEENKEIQHDALSFDTDQRKLILTSIRKKSFKEVGRSQDHSHKIAS